MFKIMVQNLASKLIFKTHDKFDLFCLRQPNSIIPDLVMDNRDPSHLIMVGLIFPFLTSISRLLTVFFLLF